MGNDVYEPYALDVKALNNRIDFELKGPRKITALKMFDLGGHEVLEKKVIKPVSTVSLFLGSKKNIASGRYVLDIITTNGVIPYRVSIKR